MEEVKMRLPVSDEIECFLNLPIRRAVRQLGNLICIRLLPAPDKTDNQTFQHKKNYPFHEHVFTPLLSFLAHVD